MNCKNCIVLDSLDTAWKELSEQYASSPSEETRQALNLLSKIVRKVRSDFEEQAKINNKDSLSTKDFLDFFGVNFGG